MPIIFLIVGAVSSASRSALVIVQAFSLLEADSATKCNASKSSVDNLADPLGIRPSFGLPLGLCNCRGIISSRFHLGNVSGG